MARHRSKLMPKSLVTGIALLIIGGLCGLALTQTHQLTRAPIEENRIRQAQALLSELLGQEAPTNLRWVIELPVGLGNLASQPSRHRRTDRRDPAQ